MKQKTLIFDQDGTLNRCAEYYKQCQENFAQYKSKIVGLPASNILRMLGEIDLGATSLPDAFKRHRFPRSFMATSYAIDVLMERELRHEEAKEAFKIGDAVFDADYTLYEGAYSTLQTLKEQGWQLILVTKGDDGVQWSKVYKNKLDKIFDPHHIYVTLQKNTEFLQGITAKHNVDIAGSWVIGDSLKDDIAPAKELGLNTVLVESGHKWTYDDHAAVPTTIMPSIAEFPKYLEAREALLEKLVCV